MTKSVLTPWKYEIFKYKIRTTAGCFWRKRKYWKVIWCLPCFLLCCLLCGTYYILPTSVGTTSVGSLQAATVNQRFTELGLQSGSQPATWSWTETHCQHDKLWKMTTNILGNNNSRLLVFVLAWKEAGLISFLLPTSRGWQRCLCGAVALYLQKERKTNKTPQKD